MKQSRRYQAPRPIYTSLLPNPWDILSASIVLLLLASLAWGGQQMLAPYELGEPIPISLDWQALPHYALRTVVRMLIALLVSLLASFSIGTLAAKSKRAEVLLIPLIDILQSVPILGFLSLSVVVFISLFPDSLLGPECAAIFAIFTSQAWNMILSFYQSLKSLPDDLTSLAASFKLSNWQKFWRLEVPFAIPGLLWNMMISLSGGWFFVVACEAISVAHQEIMLPGIGSYIAMAIKQSNLNAIRYAIAAMLLVILAYDQILFRPLMFWSTKFQAGDDIESNPSQPWAYQLFSRTRLLSQLGVCLNYLFDRMVTLPWLHRPSRDPSIDAKTQPLISDRLWYAFITLALLTTALSFARFVYATLPFDETLHVLFLGLLTGLRVLAVIIVATAIWLPLGVWVGFRPKWASRIQPVAQFLAAFPANLLFPLMVMLIVKHELNPNIWLSLLMLLGTQWYILFNVIAGTRQLPKDLIHVARHLDVKGLLYWKRIIAPGILPFYVTGAMTAAGGAWNASILAEVVHWGGASLQAEGIGAYITTYTEQGDFARVALGIAVMCVFVTGINRLVWQRLYDFAQERCGG